MRIVIDKDKCTGHARCNIVAGDLYPLTETGHIAIDGFEVQPGDEVMARRGARSCPERIITVVED
jgi:ferredoxin